MNFVNATSIRKLVPIIFLYYQFVKPFEHFRFLNLDPFEFVCELNYPIRMRKKLNQSSVFYRYIAKVYGNMMN